MTSFLTPGMGGIGSSPTQSTDTSALKAINSRDVSYANKDFVKNIAWLNNSVDTLSQWSQKLQSGVDAANQNFIEQIQGLIADFIVAFSGGQPTGVDLGDLQYVFEGIGALFGVNPDTPFPMNLIDAASHFFSTYIVPQQQFSDVIYDSIFAWAGDLGLSQELIDSFHELQDAQLELDKTWAETWDAINNLFAVFRPESPEWGELWDAVDDLFAGIPTLDLKPVISMLADLGIPFINGLTWLVRQANSFLTPLSNISGAQVTELGDNVIPPPTDDTTIWGVGSNDVNSWMYDATAGSFTTLGTSTAKRIVTQAITACTPGSVIQASMKLKWQGIPVSSTGVGIGLVFMLGQNEVTQINVKIPDVHTANSDWYQIAAVDITVPQNVDGVRFAVWVDPSITSGRVQIKDMTAQPKGFVKIGYIDQLTDWLESLVPLNVWAESLGIHLPTSQDVIDWIAGVLKQGDSINAGNLFGDLPRNMLDIIPLSSLTQDEPNFLTDPSFLDPSGIDGRGIWFWDGTTGDKELGSARVVANGTRKALLAKDITKTVKNQRLSLKIRVKWGLLAKAGTGDGFALDIILYKGNTKFDTIRIDKIANPATGGSDWTTLQGGYTVDDSQVDGYRMRIVVTEQVTSGIIHFDDAENRRTQLIALDWIDGAVDWFTDLGDQINSFVQSCLDALNGFFDPNGDIWSWIQDLGESLSDLWTDAQDAVSNALEAMGWINGDGTDWLTSLGDQINTFLQNSLTALDGFFNPSGDAWSWIADLGNSFVDLWNDTQDALSDSNTAIGWLARVIKDIEILLDVFHLVYQNGTSSDTKNSKGTNPLLPGYNKPTYWAAWKDLMEALGWANNGTPQTNPAPAVATRFNALSSAVTTGATGTASTINTDEKMIEADEVQSAVDSLRNSVIDNSNQLEDLNSAITGATTAQTMVLPSGSTTTWGGSWTLVGGTGKSSGGNFQWLTGTTLLGFYSTNDATMVDGCQVSLMTSSANQVPWLGSSNANVFVFSNANSRTAAADFIFSKLYAKKVEFGHYRNGTWTVLSTYNLASGTFPSTARIQHTISPGSAANRINYVVQVNGRIVIDQRTANLTIPFSIDSSHIINGMGMMPDGTYKPAMISSWTMLPGGKTFIPGSMVIATSPNLYYSGGSKYPTGWTISHADTDKFGTGVFEGTNNGLLFKDSAMYAIEVIFFIRNSGDSAAAHMSQNQQVRLLLYQNNNTTLIGSSSDFMGQVDVFNGDAGVAVVAHTFIRMIRGGSVLMPGVNTIGTMYGKFGVFASKLGRG